MMGRYGVKERKEEGQDLMVMDYVKRVKMAVRNILRTGRSGGWHVKVEGSAKRWSMYVVGRRQKQKEVRDVRWW